MLLFLHHALLHALRHAAAFDSTTAVRSGMAASQWWLSGLGPTPYLTPFGQVPFFVSCQTV